MPFPTVKTSPYATKRPRRRPASHLWTVGQWVRLMKQAIADHDTTPPGDISGPCLDLIRSFNEATAA